MLRPKSPQSSFYGSYLYDKIVPADHLLRKINQVVDFSFVHDLVKDRYTPDFGRPAEDPESTQSIISKIESEISDNEDSISLIRQILERIFT